MSTSDLPPTPQPQVLMSWQAPIQAYHERSKRWYTIGGGVVLLGVVYGILTDSWPLSIVILLTGAMYFLLRGHRPPLRQIIITTEGFFLENIFTRFDAFSGFWLLPTPEYTELHFSPKSARSPDIIIQTGATDPAELRAILSECLPELPDKQEGLLDILLRLTKL